MKTRRAMIEVTPSISMRKQCELLQVCRSSVYCELVEDLVEKVGTASVEAQVAELVDYPGSPALAVIETPRVSIGAGRLVFGVGARCRQRM